jgi:hypothetical protein
VRAIGLAASRRCAFGSVLASAGAAIEAASGTRCHPNLAALAYWYRQVSISVAELRVTFFMRRVCTIGPADLNFHGKLCEIDVSDNSALICRAIRRLQRSEPQMSRRGRAAQDFRAASRAVALLVVRMVVKPERGLHLTDLKGR